MKKINLIVSVTIFTMACTRPVASDKIFIDLSEKVQRSEDLTPQIEKAEFFQIAMTAPKKANSSSMGSLFRFTI